MKKTQVALAALALMASTAALADGVKISGRVEMSAQNVSGTDSNAKDTLAGYNLAGSEIRFTGEEDLGGGLKANFYLATGFDLSRGRVGEGGESTQFAFNGSGTAAAGDTYDVNQQTLFNRGAYVGLSGDFGSVNFGRNYTLTTTYFATGDVNGGNSNSVMHMVQTAMAANFWADRAITYTSPNLSGFTLSGQWIDSDKTLINTGTATAAGKGQAYAIAYSAGDLNASVATMRNGCLSTSGTCWTSTVWGANYTLGQWKFGLGGTQTGDTTKTNDPTGYFHDAVGNPFSPQKGRGWFASTNYTMDALTLGLSYYSNKKSANSDDATLTALSARYAMSGRTTLFAQYNVAAKQNDGDGYGSNYNGVSADASKSARAIFAGVLHKF